VNAIAPVAVMAASARNAVIPVHAADERGDEPGRTTSPIETNPPAHQYLAPDATR
jgi:hypothetical protein